MSNPQTVSAAKAVHPCNSCLREGACLGAIVQNAVLGAGEDGCISTATLQRGQPLYRVGDAVNAVYVVQAGALKSRRTSFQGDEEILAFRMPGDTVGLDSISARRHDTEAVALCATRVCRLPIETLRRKALGSQELSDQLFETIGDEFNRLHERLHNERRPAQARIASLLIAQLRRRQRLFGAQIDRFTLPMTRVDLGRFLGLATETVSRMFTRLQTEGVIACEGNGVRILDPQTLAALADDIEAAPPLARAA